MNRMKTTAASMAAVASMATIGALTISAAPAGAADAYVIEGTNILVVELNHAETVAAADIGAGNVINAVLGNDHWSVYLNADSKFAGQGYHRPDKATTWNDVTGAQVISEAAAKPNGSVIFAVLPDQPDKPLWVAQVW